MSEERRSAISADRLHLSISGICGTIALVIVAIVMTAFVPKGNSIDPVQSFAQASEIPPALVGLARSEHAHLEEARNDARSFHMVNGSETPAAAIRPGEWIPVSCKIYDPEPSEESSESYVYRIESPPQRRLVYVTSSAFWNGVYPNQGVPLRDADPSVPDCPQVPTAVAVGAHGTILSTIDSIHWTLRHSGVSTNLYGIARSSSFPPFSPGFPSSSPPLWIAVGAHGTILDSKNGTKWSRDSSPTRNNLFAVDTNSSVWIAVGANGTVLVSLNGLNWTTRPSGTTERLRSVSLGDPNNQWITGGGGDQWIVGGDQTILDSQDDGSTWTNANPGLEDDDDIHSVLTMWAGPSLRLAASATPALSGPNVPKGSSAVPIEILNSDDGVNWRDGIGLNTEASVPLGSVYSLVNNSVFSNTVTAVGEFGEILSSDDGTSWTALNSGVTGTLFAVSMALGSPSQPMIAVGAHGTILTSATGDAWKVQQSGTHQALYGVCPNFSATPFGS